MKILLRLCSLANERFHANRLLFPPSNISALCRKQIMASAVLVALGMVLLLMIRPVSAEETPYQTLATFPEPLREVWPDADGAYFVQGKDHLYLWDRNNGIQSIDPNSIGKISPYIASGWSDQCIALQKSDESLVIIRPGPLRLITFPKRVDNVEPYPDENIIVCYSRKYTGYNYFDEAFSTDLEGKLLPGSEITGPGLYQSAAGIVNGKKVVAIVRQWKGKPSCWLLSEEGKILPTSTFELPSGWSISKLYFSGSEKAIVVVASHALFQNDLWMLSAETGKLVARIHLPRPMGQPTADMSALSTNGRWLAYWGGSRLGMVDLRTKRISLSKVMRNRWYRSAFPDEDGNVFSVVAQMSRASKIDVYRYMIGNTQESVLWTSPAEDSNYIADSHAHSVWIDKANSAVILRYENSLISLPAYK